MWSLVVNVLFKCACADIVEALLMHQGELMMLNCVETQHVVPIAELFCTVRTNIRTVYLSSSISYA